MTPRETLSSYVRRGGQITRAPLGFSKHLLERRRLVHRLNGYTDEEATLGWSRWDAPWLVWCADLLHLMHTEEELIACEY